MTFRTLLLTAILIGSSCVLSAQEDVKISKKDFKTGIDIGFKEAWESVRMGDELYESGVGTYDMARDHYLFAYQYNPDNAALNYKLGICYMYTDSKYEAIDYFKKAYTIDPEVSEDINLVLAQAQQLVLEFDQAIKHYNAFNVGLSATGRQEYGLYLAKRITECKNAKVLVREPVRVILQNVGDAVNSRYDDYNPVFAYDDTTLYITSRRPFEDGKRNPFDNKYYEDIYRSSFVNGVFQEAVRVQEPFNSKSNDAIVGWAVDGGRVILYRGDVQGGDLSFSNYDQEKKKWTKPKPLKSKLTSKDGETSACTSPDGKELYFVSGNRELTIGGKDILFASQNEKGKWSKPINLGREINTPYDEEGVFITPDNLYLYFASKGHNTMGGYDIFRCFRNPDGGWSTPENLGFPINTPDDEVFFVTDKTGKYGYYSAVRDGGYGAKDIYRIVYLGAQKDLLFRTKDRLLAGENLEKKGFLTTPVPLVLDSSIHLEGYVLDSVGETKGLMARLSFVNTDDGTQSKTIYTDTTGFFHVEIQSPTLFVVEIIASDYLYFNAILDLIGEEGEEVLKRKYYLKKVEVGTKVVMDNIYFETGKSVLQPESFAALDEIFIFLDNNPDMKLEISGHTDNTGSLRINQRLSTERARAVVKYLVEQGATEENLSWKGYADSQPIEGNDTPEGREQNRRVEFKVLAK